MTINKNLRTLKKNKFGKTVQEIEDDQKFLKTGKIIRRLHIDEIPQFFNVLKGDMSIVGPRPHEFQEDLIYSKVFKNLPVDTTEENLQARIRGNLMMALSNKMGWLVLTTGNKSEFSVGAIFKKTVKKNCVLLMMCLL